MRTTLTLDPDVARSIKKRMADTKLPLKRVINDALRIGLGRNGRHKPRPFFVETYPCQFRPGIDLDKLNQFVDELEVEETVRKLSKK